MCVMPKAPCNYRTTLKVLSQERTGWESPTRGQESRIKMGQKNLEEMLGLTRTDISILFIVGKWCFLIPWWRGN
jgi:hypothetical protein